MPSWLKLFVGIALFAILLSFVDWGETIAILLDAALFPTLLAFVILPVNNIISTLKWGILLRAQDVRTSWSELLRYYWVGQFFNNYFPSTVGGDIIGAMCPR